MNTIFCDRRWLCAIAVTLASCSTRQAPRSLTKSATQTASAPQPVAVSADVPAIAQREVIRRQERIRQMDEAALRASEAMARDDLEGAVGGYRRAINGL